MKDQDKSKEQLIEELRLLRRNAAQREKDLARFRIQAEASRESEERLSAFVDNAPTIAWMKDEQGRYGFLSKTYETRLGASFEEWRGKTDFELWAPEVAEKFRRNDQAVLSSGQMMEMIEEVPNPNGECCYWWNFKFPFTDVSGRKYIGGVGLDITRLKRKEEALRASERRMNCLVEANIIGIILTNYRGNITEANDAFLQMVGYSRDDLLEGKVRWDEMTPPEYKETDLRAIRELKDKGFCTPFEKEYIGKDGRRVPILIGVARLGAAHEEEVVSFVLDLSTRKRMEEALKESEGRYKSLVDLSPDAILVHAEGKYVFANPAAAKLFGADSPEKIVGRNVMDLVSPDQRQFVAERIAQAYNGAVTPLRETTLIRMDGQPVAVEVRGAKVVFGGRAAIQITVRDVSAHKKAREQLRELSQRLSYHMDHSPLAVIEWGPDMALIRWSGEAERMFGWKAEEVLGKRMEDFNWVFEEDRQQVREIIIGLMQNSTSARFSANRNYRRDGSVIYCEWYNSCLVDEAGNLQSILSQALDVTERKRLEEELRKAYDQLELRVRQRTQELTKLNAALNQSRKELRLLSCRLLTAQEEERKRLAGELHDSIGGSLGAIKMSFVRTLRLMKVGRVTPESIQGLLEMINYTIEEVRRISTALRPSMLDNLGLIATIGWFCRQFETLHAGLRIVTHIEVEEKRIPEELKIVIFRVMQEAFNNIAKYSEAERVALSVRGSDDSLELAIADSGVGFDPAEMCAGRNDGGGFGLTSMRERVELSGGAFAIESEVGGGTTVRATWDVSRLVMKRPTKR